MSTKICPMTIPTGNKKFCIGSEENGVQQKPDECAWWLGDKCAIRRIGETLDKQMMQLETIIDNTL